MIPWRFVDVFRQQRQEGTAGEWQGMNPSRRMAPCKAPACLSCGSKDLTCFLLAISAHLFVFWSWATEWTSYSFMKERIPIFACGAWSHQPADQFGQSQGQWIFVFCGTLLGSLQISAYQDLSYCASLKFKKKKRKRKKKYQANVRNKERNQKSVKYKSLLSK